MLTLFLYFEAAGAGAAAIAPNTIFALAGVALWLMAGRKEALLVGFFTGVFWFWWVGLSFRFTPYPFLAPIAALAIALMYGLFFWLIAFLPLWGRAAAIAFGFLIVEPFGFAWFKPELLLINTIFSAHKAAFFCVVGAVALLVYLRKSPLPKRYILPLAAILLIAAVFLPIPSAPPPLAMRIYLANTNISQDRKWQPNEIYSESINAIKTIDSAIDEGYDLIVLPEAAFALFLNEEKSLLNALLDRSYDIAIITGALRIKDRLPYNSQYIFYRGKYEIADKVFLVPFGEASPLPKWAGRFINNLFFEGAVDYETAKKPTDFTINGSIFRAAICYEAAIEAMHKNSPGYMIAISNNGWFVPSIEPTMQKLLIKLYAKRYGTTVFHASNESQSEVIN
ncbi:apolipoprotein N-acyltransferase [Campylobacterota bacterium]|nr:apolipoprotein N-acyltransferase [Campylobacterota bacterium]